MQKVEFLLQDILFKEIKQKHMKQLLFILMMALCLPSCMDAVDTAYKEYKPSSLLKKYEWFKNQAAAIDKKRADIEVYRAELKGYDTKDKDNKFYIEQRKSELLGIISMHNELCAEYNAQMVKFNYAFTNKGSMPETNMEPLPREYKPYILTLN